MSRLLFNIIQALVLLLSLCTDTGSQRQGQHRKYAWRPHRCGYFTGVSSLGSFTFLVFAIDFQSQVCISSLSCRFIVLTVDFPSARCTLYACQLQTSISCLIYMKICETNCHIVIHTMSDEHFRRQLQAVAASSTTAKDFKSSIVFMEIEKSLQEVCGFKNINSTETITQYSFLQYVLLQLYSNCSHISLILLSICIFYTTLYIAGRDFYHCH